GRADVRSRVHGQPLGRRRGDKLDVDMEVVLLLPVPGKGHLIAIRGKAWGLLRTRIAGEWHHLRCGLRFSGSPANKPARGGYRHENECSSHPDPGPLSWPNHKSWPGRCAQVGFLLTVPEERP